MFPTFYNKETSAVLAVSLNISTKVPVPTSNGSAPTVYTDRHMEPRILPLTPTQEVIIKLQLVISSGPTSEVFSSIGMSETGLP